MTTFATIMDKLKQNPMHPNYIRHVNGDTIDNRVENLEWVNIRDAFKHINDWKVDWVCYVTEEERTFLVNFLKWVVWFIFNTEVGGMALRRVPD